MDGWNVCSCAGVDWDQLCDRVCVWHDLFEKSFAFSVLRVDTIISLIKY